MTQAPTASLTLTPATSPATTPAGGKDFASSVIYQVYPKSFYSSAGGAYGDLRGVIEKVPYIASLGRGHGVVQPVLRLPAERQRLRHLRLLRHQPPTWAP